MSSHDPVADILGTIADCLAGHHIRWYLFGAQAVVVWGRPRLTADIDITVEVEPDDSARLAEALDRVGFDLRIRENVKEFTTRTRVLPLVHRASGIQLDVVLAGPGLEQRFLDRAESIALGGRQIPVISPEDLIVTKMLAGRPKDVEDVRGILAERHRQLDLAAIRELLRLLEQALDRSDLLPQLEDELERAQPVD